MADCGDECWDREDGTCWDRGVWGIEQGDDCERGKEACCADEVQEPVRSVDTLWMVYEFCQPRLGLSSVVWVMLALSGSSKLGNSLKNSA